MHGGAVVRTTKHSSGPSYTDDLLMMNSSSYQDHLNSDNRRSFQENGEVVTNNDS